MTQETSGKIANMGIVCALLVVCIYIPVLSVGVWSLCPARRLPDFLTKASFSVYLLHRFAIQFFMLILPLEGMTAARYIFFDLVSFASCVFASYILHRVAPRLSAVLFGGR